MKNKKVSKNFGHLNFGHKKFGRFEFRTKVFGNKCTTRESTYIVLIFVDKISVLGQRVVSLNEQLEKCLKTPMVVKTV